MNEEYDDIICSECRSNGDNYYINWRGDIISNCDDCPCNHGSEED